MRVYGLCSCGPVKHVGLVAWFISSESATKFNVMEVVLFGHLSSYKLCVVAGDFEGKSY